MPNNRASDQGSESSADAVQGGDPSRPLIALISSLVRQLESMQSNAFDEEELGQAECDHWLDESYCYFELRLPEELPSEIDVSVAGSKAFIRLRR